MIKIEIPEDMLVVERNFKMALAIIQLSEIYEPSELSKVFGDCRTSVPVFDVNDIEEIAKHLLAYVDRFRKDERN